MKILAIILLIFLQLFWLIYHFKVQSITNTLYLKLVEEIYRLTGDDYRNSVNDGNSIEAMFRGPSAKEWTIVVDKLMNSLKYREIDSLSNLYVSIDKFRRRIALSAVAFVFGWVLLFLSFYI
jgi:hypothetical protein